MAGSSLTVFSGYRFMRHAAAQGLPIAIVNRGPTRGDDLAPVKVDGGCSETLTLLVSELAGAPGVHTDKLNRPVLVPSELKKPVLASPELKPPMLLSPELKLPLLSEPEFPKPTLWSPALLPPMS